MAKEKSGRRFGEQKDLEDIKLSGGKLIKEISVESLERRKVGIDRKIEGISSIIAERQEEIISLQEDITALEGQKTKIDEKIALVSKA